MTRRLRLTMGVVLSAGVIITLAACSTSQPHQAPASAPNLDHVHALAEADNGGLLVASHTGIYEVTSRDDTAEVSGPVGDISFDAMGFVASENTWYTSGHPGDQSPEHFAAPNLGLLTSGDSGQSWESVSLSGKADFHALTASPGDANRLYGVRTNSQQLQVSTDGGATWQVGASLAARMLVADNNPDIVYATTEDGFAVSSDAGATFTVQQDAPPLFLLAADPSRGGNLTGIDVSGTVWEQEGDRNWVSGGTIDGVPQAILVTSEGSLVLALEHEIIISNDLGESWSTLVDVG